MSKIDKIRAKKAEFVAKLEALKKEEATAQSAANTARKKADDRTKMLLGVLCVGLIKSKPAMIDLLNGATSTLSKSEREFLGKSTLWADLGLAAPETTQAGPREPKPAASA